ncbi:FAD-dependent monooxygenase [Pelagibacteraceae bacterium]|nr:FAD-dependent monooxygenase [Pelagibacteraceae bacterium]
MNYDFIIYGGGISSEIAALALAKNNFKVCYVKNQTVQKTESNLVTFLSSGSVNYLYSIIDDPLEFNKFTDIEKISCRLASIKDGSSIIFENEPNSTMGKILPNKIISGQLASSLKENKNIDTLFKTKSIRKETHSNKVSIVIDEQKEIFARVLILSVNDENLLEQNNIKFISQDIKQTAFSINVKGEFKKQNHAFQIFTSNGPLAFLPYTHNQASLVWSLKNDSKELNYEKSELESKVNDYFEKEIGALKIENIETHKLNFLYAKKLYHGNTVLMGNIAHNIHPIAGQGLNLSIKDISLFVEVILKYTSLGYEVNNRMAFKEFDQLRKIDNAAYSFGTLALDKILKSKNTFLSMFANMGIKILDKNNFLKRKIIKNATGVENFKAL